MTQTEEIIEGNRLIAEFMSDGKLYPHPARILEGQNAPMGYNFSEPLGWRNKNSLQYHTSWDWLMPVVEKIEIINHDLYSFEIVCCRSIITEFVNDNDDLLKCTQKQIVRVTADTKIQSAWQAVTQFIKWYNSQSK